jgi:hypothetical protein
VQNSSMVDEGPDSSTIGSKGVVSTKALRDSPGLRGSL